MLRGGGFRVLPRRRRRAGGGGFLPDAARRWLLARCCGAAEASCPMLRGGGSLPNAVLLWLRCHLSLNVLRTDSYAIRKSFQELFCKCKSI